MATTFIGITNYRVVNNLGRRNIGRKTGEVIIKITDILFVLGVIATVDGRSDTLLNIFNNSGLMCITDKQGWEKILEEIGPIKRPINTYTVINGVSRLNDTFYLDYSTITKLLPISTKDGSELYQCTTSTNILLFTTDEEGVQSITGGVSNNKKQIQGCDSMKIITMDFDKYEVTDGLTYNLTFNDAARAGCYTILGDSVDGAIDVVKSVSLPLSCNECGRVES